ncbi:nuclear polyadenylated RNA-binding protein 3-like [Trifolium pratense]|uniref:nuclear polyadenylated RNA-binding protein 3-like n=1 Tax=Trifolium pratense TaxID=57577 RepID=UPI001E694548|nr:nuclear polyadenylated RNA-binding protein 3-like [Trifolium pratense]
MLDSILEMITQAASSSTFIFCFCNLIIVIILMDLKPRISVHQRSEFPLSIYEIQKQEINTKFSFEKSIESMTQEKEVSHVIEAEANEDEDEENKIEIGANDDIDCNNEEGKEENEKEHEEEKDDDELRKRVEEFIEKVNKKWKEELLSTSSLVYERKNNEILAI